MRFLIKTNIFNLINLTGKMHKITPCAYHKVIFQQISSTWKIETKSVLNLLSTGGLGMQCDNLLNEDKKRALGNKYQRSMFFINFNSNHVFNYFLILLEPKYPPVLTNLPTCLLDFYFLRRQMDRNFICLL